MISPDPRVSDDVSGECLRSRANDPEHIYLGPLVSGEALNAVNALISTTVPPTDFLESAPDGIRKRNYYLLSRALEMFTDDLYVSCFLVDSHIRSAQRYKGLSDDTGVTLRVLRRIVDEPGYAFTDALVVPGDSPPDGQIIGQFLGAMYGLCGVEQTAPDLLRTIDDQHIEFFRSAIGADKGQIGADTRIYQAFGSCFGIDTEEYYQSTQRQDPAVKLGFCSALLMTYYARKDCRL